MSGTTHAPLLLLDESVQIVFTAAPAAAQEARTLAERWGEQELLDPDSAPGTRARLDEEIDRAEDRLARLLARQEQIAAELRQLTNDQPDGD